MLARERGSMHEMSLIQRIRRPWHNTRHALRRIYSHVLKLRQPSAILQLYPKRNQGHLPTSHGHRRKAASRLPLLRLQWTSMLLRRRLEHSSGESSIQILALAQKTLLRWTSSCLHWRAATRLISSFTLSSPLWSKMLCTAGMARLPQTKASWRRSYRLSHIVREQ